MAASKPLSRAYDPKDSIWKLGTLADSGLCRDDERIATLAEKIFAAQAEDGGFLHGGFDHTRSWHTRPYICISHVKDARPDGSVVAAGEGAAR